MAIFKKKKTEEEKQAEIEKQIPILQDRERIRKLVRQYQEETAEKRAAGAEEAEQFSLESRQYRQFKSETAEAAKPQNFYEKAAFWAGKSLKVRVKEKDAVKMQSHLDFIGYTIKPADVMSLSMLMLVLCVVIGGAMILINFMVALVTLFAGLILMFIIQKYPKYMSDIETIETMNYMPLAIMYMVIYMRTAPTLEGAVKFTSKHLRGPLARDLRGLLWKMETGAYLNMDDALRDYAGKWVDRNKAFSQAIEVLRNSEQIGIEAERLNMLDEAAKIILEGNFSMMQNFARGLRMPIIALYMLCIVLPVMGLVVTPILVTLMAQSMNPWTLVVTYNVVLPLVVYAMSKMILKKRPGSFTQPDIENYPGLPKPGHFALKTKSGKVHQLPLKPLAILTFFLVSMPGILLFWNGLGEGFQMMSIITSVTFIWGMAASIAVYTLGSSAQKVSIRKRLKDIEGNLDVALFQLGDMLAMGTPLEVAIEDSAIAIKKGAIKGFFQRTAINMEEMNMPVEKAIFDPEVGAIVYYPSKLVSTIMEVLIESSRKGLSATSTSMLTISNYLKNLKKIKESIEELIGKTVGAMKFQAQFLTSFITGIIVSLDVLLFKILSQLGGQMDKLQSPGNLQGVGVAGIFENSMFNVASVIPAEYMQLIVGVYMVEVTVLLSLLINGTENGRDNISRNMIIGKNVITATVIYTIAIIVGTLMFSSFNISVA